MSYLYKTGLIVGRFQMLHNGHKQIVEQALELCRTVVVFIGSSQEALTKNNPFSYYVRKQMFEKVFATEVATKRLIIKSLPDIGVGNNDIWGRYVLGRFEAAFNKLPDIYISGCEKVRSTWFNNDIAPTTDELRITRTHINVSATQCRELVANGDFETCRQYIPEELYDDFEFYQKIIKESK